ncbi:uncharacterized protein LOC118436863 [Folsomia candida]|uniref:F-box domain-containing protein n=1 Tax=Folsomia candida TaxID=158441 RepID=A0A226DYD3_FOLCA|nr:uncharacterized protein LOC118436863 [Folsomia candida]OXA49226.1 hypothetical protein Fcan01_16020 [Folsomia candida]
MSGRLLQPPDAVFESVLMTDCDLNSVILPYRERCRYTLGEKYVSWDTQSEFIFVKTKRPQWDWSFGLEILCGHDAYWAKPVKGSFVFRNGIKYYDRVKIRLNFGDELVFAKHRDGISGGLARFIFKRREYATNVDKSIKSGPDSDAIVRKNGAKVNFSPGENQLIFSKILSYLPFKSLKNARLVCRHWDEHVSPILRKKSVINFYPGLKSANPSLKFLQYVHEMQNWPRWKISYPKLPTPLNDISQRGAKYILDLDWFLNPMRGHCVQSLSLFGDIYTNYDYKTYLKAALRLKDTLEELHLEFGIKILGYNGIEENYSEVSINFKKLTKFSLALNFLEGEPSPATRLVAGWMKPWADAVKDVESISTSVRCDTSLGSRFIQELQNSGANLYKNLKEVSLTCKPEDGINFLTELNNPLKKMTFTTPLETRHFPDFEKLLKKFASSLELLSFRVDTDDLEPKVLNLPCLPDLKTLNFHFEEFSDGHFYAGCLRFAFPPLSGDHDVGINYDRHLPSIRSIVISPEFYEDEDATDSEDDVNTFWDVYSDLIDSLLPKEGQTCKTLRNFELPDFDDTDTKTETRYRQAHRLPEVFPNVRNKWMDYGRCRSIKGFFSV